MGPQFFAKYLFIFNPSWGRLIQSTTTANIPKWGKNCSVIGQKLPEQNGDFRYISLRISKNPDPQIQWLF